MTPLKSRTPTIGRTSRRSSSLRSSSAQCEALCCGHRVATTVRRTSPRSSLPWPGPRATNPKSFWSPRLRLHQRPNHLASPSASSDGALGDHPSYGLLASGSPFSKKLPSRDSHLLSSGKRVFKTKKNKTKRKQRRRHRRPSKVDDAEEASDVSGELL